MSRSILLLPNTENNMSVTGAPVRADGARLFTVSIHTSNFRGWVHVEATLKAEPQEDDWFPVFAPKEYMHDTGTVGETFKGSFAHIRARMSRPKLFGNEQSGMFGAVDRILLSL
jgi:hypothetical protein